MEQVGSYQDVMTVGANLYALRDSPHGCFGARSQIVRIPASTGRVAATSQVLPSAQLPIAIGSHLWLVSVASESRNCEHMGPQLLIELNPSTLGVERQERLPSKVGILGTELVGASPTTFWVIGSGAGNVCEGWRVDPTSGVLARTAGFKFKSDGCAGVTLDTSATGLYVAPAGFGGPPSVSLYRLDAETGHTEAHTSIWVGGVYLSMVATPSRLWIASGGMGGDGGLTLLRASNLKEIPAQFPDTSEYPTLNFSGGRVWIGGEGVLGCIRPSDSHVLATGLSPTRPFVTGPIVVVGRRAWGIADSGSGPSGLARIFPPSRCF